MKIAAGSDSRTNLTDTVISYLEAKSIEVLRLGALAGQESDYVDAAVAVAEAVKQGDCQQGVLFCNTGTGASIIANKIPGVRAALCPDAYAAKIARLANNANVIILSIRLTGEPLSKDIIDTWLSTEPSTEPRRMLFHAKTDEIDTRYKKD